MTSKPIYYCVYRITNLVLRKHYYGYKSSKNHPSEVVGKSYFSSSKDKSFIADQKLHPENYRYKIVRIFDNKDSALQLEIKLHNLFEVSKNINFYNRSKQSSVGFDTTGAPVSEESNRKRKETWSKKLISENYIPNRTNSVQSVTTKEKIKETWKLKMKSGYVHPFTGRKLEDNHLLKQPRRNETKELLSKTKRNSAPAKIKETNHNIGNISLDDLRWKTGEIVGIRTGTKNKSKIPG